MTRKQRRRRRAQSRLLGAVELDRQMCWYQGTRALRGREYEVMIDTPDPDDDTAVARAIARLESVVRRVEPRLGRIRDAISAELLDVHNQEWRQSPRPLSAAAFKRRHALESLHVQDQRVTLYFDCDGLFEDHVVEVRLSPRLAIREVCVAG